MGFLDSVLSLFSGGTGSGGRIDPALNDPQAKQLLAAIARYDVSSTNQLLLTLREGRWNDRAFYVHVTSPALVPLVDSALTAWCKNEPSSPIPFLLRGAAVLDSAWQARGKASAQDTSSAQFKAFAALLGKAKTDFEKVISLDPKDPTPHALLIEVARGLGNDAPTRAAALKAALQLDPHHWAAHWETVLSVAPKWGGTSEELFAFADKIAASAPPASGLGFLRIAARLEIWIVTLAGGDSAAANAALGTPEVRAEVARIVASSAVSGPWSVLPWNLVAFWAFVVDEHPLLKQALERIGSGFSNYPWTYSSDREASLQAARRMVGL